MTQFRADTSAVTGWGQQVSSLSDEVASFVSGAPATSGVQNSHGTIGFPMQDVLEAAQSARGSALGATQSASAKIGDLLKQAAQAYERGDSEAAARLKAQADRMESAQPESRQGTGTVMTKGAQGAPQPAGQVMSQFGQVAGQMMQGMTQPVQGAVQGLSQIPQQAMQGAQGIVQSAMQGAGGGGAAAADAAAKASVAGAGPGAGAPPGQRPPVQSGIMSEERMRELQGLPPFGGEVMGHAGGDVMGHAGGDVIVHGESHPRLPPIYGDWPDSGETLEPGPSQSPPVSRNWPNDDMPDTRTWESPPFLPDKS
ncbi:ESX-1 secretion-associated protein [Mycolicibacterium brisbanense]|uniref:ESX-1 secretion-associated protein n=1 Tax=Mycolicibacterium brisbanense TaxID=146020 RepID=A0A117I5T7_9MYCO|nr:ESX-1 secretion-associated protein [Mycolicibacterium brisbanense]MCV7160540.1 ESX-1 secretion-associated protein [Mycolicibacterium brisbanense]GAS88995.1 uncharacterized protein RMCB_3091 [Mycolicibacterium brisbanense]